MARQGAVGNGGARQERKGNKMATIEHLREIIGGDTESLKALERLADSTEGNLTPEAVLNAARVAESPLHKHFEWDDSVAAEAYRKDQARQLIQSYKLHIVDDRGERTLRYYTNVIVEDEHAYRRTEDVIRVDALREQRRMRIVRELNRIRTELETFDSFGEAASAVSAAIEAMQPQPVG